jgi:hypothetical protein
MEKRLNEFINFIKEDEFFKAHEVLEEVWFPKRFQNNNEIKFLKGLINASVSFELLKRGRIKRYEQVWQNYLKYNKLFDKFHTEYYHKYLFIINFLNVKKEILEKRYIK